METIQLNLSLHEINQILEALGDRPYKEVFELINRVQEQAQSQLASKNQSNAVSTGEHHDESY